MTYASNIHERCIRPSDSQDGQRSKVTSIHALSPVILLENVADRTGLRRILSSANLTLRTVNQLSTMRVSISLDIIFCLLLIRNIDNKMCRSRCVEVKQQSNDRLNVGKVILWSGTIHWQLPELRWVRWNPNFVSHGNLYQLCDGKSKSQSERHTCFWTGWHRQKLKKTV